jgi:photosystem II stability/assembly factor-like uncharacterized protein
MDYACSHALRSDSSRIATRTFALAACLLLLLPRHSIAQGTAPPAGLAAAQYSALRYRHIGPEGNRAIAVAGVPGNPLIAFIGAASGGLWKTTDGGVNWRSVFDDKDVSSVSSLAIAPSDPNVVWAGTGETFIIRPALSIGNGIYKSTDAGDTWTRSGLEATGRIGRIIVHPTNPDIVFACAEGHAFGPQQERGIFRTKDGGATWDRVLFVDENTGCADLAIDAKNPRILLAGMWQLLLRPWKLDSGGPGSGVFLSKDGGDTWTRLTNGLPSRDEKIGKIAVDIARSDPKRMYALIEAESPSFYRSDDAGASWRLVSQDHDMSERASYYTRFRVDPVDENRIYFVSVRFSTSLDGGATLTRDVARGGGDNHDIWIDPLNPDRYMIADDGGGIITLTRGRSTQRVVLPIAQMYHVYTDNQIPYYVYGNRQDGYSYRGPSNSRSGAIVEGHWQSFGGCESGFGIPDPADSNIAWSGCYDGGLDRTDLATGHSRSVRVWPEATYGWPPSDVKFRWHWTFPIHMSPHDPKRVYVGSQFVHVTTDGGQSWKIISPDLTLNDRTKQASSGGATTDNLMTFDGSVLYSIAESPVEAGVIWAGSNDGQISITRDNGGTWTNMTQYLLAASLPGAKKGNGPALGEYGTIANIEPSKYAAGTAYIAVDRHQMGDFSPYIFKTTDYGRSWTRIGDGIPKSVLSYVHVVREDPVRQGLLWAGTENMVWFSLDDGGHWLTLRNNMPPAPIYWLTIQPHFSDLVVGTYGRGFWIMDDITPIRALNANVMANDVQLLEPRDAYRFQSVQNVVSSPNSQVTGQNPPYGGDINYWLKTKPEGDMKLTVLDSAGAVIRELDPTRESGLNRVWWDLRYEPPRSAKLRTQPPGKDNAEFNDEGWRPLVSWDLDLNPGQVGPLAPPGRYTIRLHAGGRDYNTTLTVLKDPSTRGTVAEVRAQVAMSLQLRDRLNETVDMINDLEYTRKQLVDLAERYEADTTKVELVRAAAALREKATAIEGRLYDINLTGAREDAFRAPMQLYGKFSSLATDVGAIGADFGPTAQQGEVYQYLESQLNEAKIRFREMHDKDLPAFREILRRAGLPDIITEPPEDSVSPRPPNIRIEANR